MLLRTTAESQTLNAHSAPTDTRQYCRQTRELSYVHVHPGVKGSICQTMMTTNKTKAFGHMFKAQNTDLTDPNMVNQDKSMYYFIWMV